MACVRLDRLPDDCSPSMYFNFNLDIMFILAFKTLFCKDVLCTVHLICNEVFYKSSFFSLGILHYKKKMIFNSDLSDVVTET